MFRAPRTVLAVRSQALSLSIALAIAGTGCGLRQVRLRRSDGFSQSFSILSASHWQAKGHHHALLELEDPGSTMSDTSATVTVLFRFVDSPEGPRAKDAQVSLVRAFHRGSRCVNASVQILPRGERWSLAGAVLFPEGEKESLLLMEAFELQEGSATPAAAESICEP